MSGKGRCLVQAATLRGVEAVPVDVEVAVSSGVPGFAIVGMADASVQESRERVKAALRSCGFTMPASKIVVNLAPGALRKTGSGFDLPIAAGILVATGQVDPSALERALFVGELSLEGAVRPVAGLLAYALCARMLGVGLVSAEVERGVVCAWEAGVALRAHAGGLPHPSFSPCCGEEDADTSRVFRFLRYCRARYGQASPANSCGRRARSADDGASRIRQDHACV